MVWWRDVSEYNKLHKCEPIYRFRKELFPPITRKSDGFKNESLNGFTLKRDYLDKPGPTLQQQSAR